MIDIQQLQVGQQVYIIYRNPHTQTVSTIQEATIARDPMNPEQLSLLLFDFYHPIEADDALFNTYEEAESMFEQFYM
ncbi:transcriptional regulator SplA domain-containing protein [Halalkalibacter alkalisediminis]|uniref:Transcriptional regulator SplA domain-containing protein n=1 Tax=Halalkalibacter alkalisediminis TaxID=935616 RepID=A0ABV6NFF2_9BACI|nr:transcriptional regulator SplA domain-containing protein [Halalkalibacter alkalisediminis]